MKSAKPLDAAKKLLNSICEYEGLTKNNKLKCKAHFYIRETTKDSKKRIYGPYKGSFKKYDKPVIIKLDNGREIKYKMYAEVIKIKSEKKETNEPKEEVKEEQKETPKKKGGRKNKEDRRRREKKERSRTS